MIELIDCVGHLDAALVLVGELDQGHGVLVPAGRLLQPAVQDLLLPVQPDPKLLQLLARLTDVVLRVQRGH